MGKFARSGAGLPDVEIALRDRTSLDRELERLIVEAGFAPPLSLGQAARKLAKTPRTLQRHLTRQGLTYRRVVNDLRCSHALVLLHEPGSTIEEVAARVGFSEPRAFSRAFKRWTDSPPRQFLRAQSRADDAAGSVPHIFQRA